MANAETIEELRALAEKELIEKHDNLAKNTQVGTNHYLQELYRRDQARVASEMLKYTRWITCMTVIVTVTTIINLAVLI